MIPEQNSSRVHLTTLDFVRYGVSELGVSAIESFMRLYLLIYFTDHVGLRADLAGIAVAIGVFWDAFADPVMGRVSDRTSTSIGPRFPWMIAGAPLLAASFMLLFCFEGRSFFGVEFSEWATCVVLAFLNILVNSAMTMVSIPHLALGNDITTSKGERTTLFAWRSLMTLLGLLAGIMVPAMAGIFAPGSKTPEYNAATVIVVLFLCASLVTIGSYWRNPLARRISTKAPGTLPLSFAKMRPLLLLYGSFFTATLGQGLNSVLAMYYYRYTLRLDERDLGVVLLVFIFSLALTLPLWVWLAKTRPKSQLVAIGTIGLGLASMIVYPILPAGQMAGPLMMGVVGGALLGSSGLLESLLADMAEDAQIDDSDMGQVFGIWKFAAKAARAVAIAFGGKVLAMIGYASTHEANQVLDPLVAQRIGILFGPVVGVLFVVGGVMAWRIFRPRSIPR